MTETDSHSESSDSEDPSGTSSEGRPFKDRRAGLIAFGVLELLIALGLLAMAVLQFFVLANTEKFAPGVAANSKWTFIMSAAMYSALAVVAAVLAIGSMRCRRWARSLSLMLGSFALAVGVLSAVMMVFLLPGLVRNLENQMGGARPGASFLIGCSVVGLAFFYLVIPAAFVAFYRSRHVRSTCEYYDPKPRWTDRCPLPVLAGSMLLLFGSGAVFAPFMGVGMPLFGWYVTGVGAWLVAIALGGVSVALAWGFYRMRRWALAGALGLTALNGLNVLISFRGDGLFDLYEQMEIPADQLAMMVESGIARWMTPMMTATILLMLGFYLWLGKYFTVGKP